MSLLTDVIGGLLSGSGGNPQMQNVLAGLLSGGQGGMQQAPQGGAQGSGPGGLGGLISAFQQAGLGDVMQSWINQGPNQSISPDQLHNVLGPGQAQAMANNAGMPLQDFLTQLSQHLPQAVDKMTPDGKLPDEGTLSV
jgi:uncharacterized protein YidB (DUF937 family)